MEGRKGEIGSMVAYVPVYGEEERKGEGGRGGSVSVGCEHTDIDPSLLLPHLYYKATHNVVLYSIKE